MGNVNPQQPEIRRNEKGATSADSAKNQVGTDGATAGGGAHSNGDKGRKVPKGNQPGWVDRG